MSHNKKLPENCPDEAFLIDNDRNIIHWNFIIMAPISNVFHNSDKALALRDYLKEIGHYETYWYGYDSKIFDYCVRFNNAGPHGERVDWPTILRLYV